MLTGTRAIVLLTLAAAWSSSAAGQTKNRRAYRRQIAVAAGGAMEIRGIVHGVSIGLRAADSTRRYRLRDPFDARVTGASDVASLFVAGQARRSGTVTVRMRDPHRRPSVCSVRVDRGDSAQVIQGKLMQAIGELSGSLRWVRASGRGKRAPRVATLAALFHGPKGSRRRVSKRRVISALKLRYPGKAVFPNRRHDPTEIVCEVEPTGEHPGWSRAVAAVFGSQPHLHHKTTETYRVLQGKLAVTIDGKTTTLGRGQSVKIKPGQVHSARSTTGTPALLEAVSRPGWRFDDQILVDGK